jgi:uncharacterized protein YecE (DUF72 family)
MYQGWRGAVYPESTPVRGWFERYASWFDTVEINSTFYRLPTEPAVRRWAEQAPPDFVYSVKLGSFGTHRKKLRDSASWLPNHLDHVRVLGPHRGPTLVQLPPGWGRRSERLDEFLAQAGGEGRWAVEIRDATWLHDDVYQVLARHGAALCIHDLVADVPWELTTDWTYLRFHGPHARERPYRGRYGRRRLGPVAEQLAAWGAAGVDGDAYSPNDDSGFAVQDARWLSEQLGVGPAPPGGPPARTPGSDVR